MTKTNNDMNTNTQSKLKVFKSGDYEYIYVYFKLGRNLIRVNTKNKVIKNGMTVDLLYRASVPNYKELNKKTLRLKQDVDNYIRIELKQYKPTVSQAKCDNFLKHDKTNKEVFFSEKPYIINNNVINAEKDVNDYFQDFYDYKSNELNNRLGLKDYKSLQNAIIDYQTSINKTLILSDVNTKDFIVNFRNFLSTQHPEEYLTRGNLNDNTIAKRLSNYKSFCNYLEDNEIFTFKKNIFNLKSAKFDNDIVVLNKDEIKQLVELKIENKSWQKLIDVFVCNCFFGLRFSDLCTLNKDDFFKDKDGDIYISKENKKTGIVVEIPVQKTSLDILLKYDFNLPKYANQYFNRELKEIIKHYELFPEMVTKKRRVLSANVDYSVMKRELISSHTCRRTFITLGISNNIPFNTLMLASGHKQLATLKSYVKKVQNKELFKAIDLN